jgi:hypothetical protein
MVQYKHAINTQKMLYRKKVSNLKKPNYFSQPEFIEKLSRLAK